MFAAEVDAEVARWAGPDYNPNNIRTLLAGFHVRTLRLSATLAWPARRPGVGEATKLTRSVSALRKSGRTSGGRSAASRTSCGRSRSRRSTGGRGCSSTRTSRRTSLRRRPSSRSACSRSSRCFAAHSRHFAHRQEFLAERVFEWAGGVGEDRARGRRYGGARGAAVLRPGRPFVGRGQLQRGQGRLALAPVRFGSVGLCNSHARHSSPKLVIVQLQEDKAAFVGPHTARRAACRERSPAATLYSIQALHHDDGVAPDHLRRPRRASSARRAFGRRRAGCAARGGGAGRRTTRPMSFRSVSDTSSTVLSSTMFMNWSKPRRFPVTWRLAFSLTARGRGRRSARGRREKGGRGGPEGGAGRGGAAPERLLGIQPAP